MGDSSHIARHQILMPERRRENSCIPWLKQSCADKMNPALIDCNGIVEKLRARYPMEDSGLEVFFKHSLDDD